MKRVLLTNDDGFDSVGLMALRDGVKDALNDDVEIMIIAPAREKSACGHGLSLSSPLHFEKIDDNFYKLEDGNPTDCVYLGLKAIYKNEVYPDLVLSGINLGSNMGEDVTYSGTIAGAMEATLYGIPSMAFSQVLQDKKNSSKFDFGLAKKVVSDLVKKFFEKKLPFDGRRFLNINIPQIAIDQCKGYQVTQKGFRLYKNDAVYRKDPRGREYYWLGLQPLAWRERDENEIQKQIPSDFNATKNGYVSITPITLNLTSYESLEQTKRWLEN